MVKKVLVISLVISHLFATDIYEKNCMKCHRDLPVSLKEIFMDYLLVYGGEKNMKAGIKHYLKYPSKDISMMSKLFIMNYGIKEKTELLDSELDRALDIYWDKFKIIGKLK